MNFTDSIVLNEYADSAVRIFDESENRLSQIEGSFATRLNGKTRGGIILSMIGTVIWCAVFTVFFSRFGKNVGGTALLIARIAYFALTAVLLADAVVNYSYCGKISVYKDAVSQLKTRVSIGRSSIKANQDAFMESRANGWHYALQPGSSIPDEAAAVEGILNGMQSLKGGLLHDLKNILFFVTTIAVTGVGSWMLFGVAADIVDALMGETVSETWYLVGMFIAVVANLILARKVWSSTNCAVTNVTLLAIPAGPVFFLALVALVTLIIMLVIFVVELLIIIFAVCAGGAIVFGASSGG